MGHTPRAAPTADTAHFPPFEKSRQADDRPTARARMGDRGLCKRLRQSYIANPVPPPGRKRTCPVRRPIRRDARSAHSRQLLRAAVRPGSRTAQVLLRKSSRTGPAQTVRKLIDPSLVPALHIQTFRLFALPHNGARGRVCSNLSGCEAGRAGRHPHPTPPAAQAVGRT